MRRGRRDRRSGERSVDATGDDDDDDDDDGRCAACDTFVKSSKLSLLCKHGG